MNPHVICTDPQHLIEERPEAYKSIQVGDVAEGVCVVRLGIRLRPECQGTREGDGCEDDGLGMMRRRYACRLVRGWIFGL